MEKKIVEHGGVSIAVVSSREVIITDGQSALDFIMTIQYYNNYYNNCLRIALNKEALSKEFFILSTGIAGEILQKFSNYRAKFAIIGDFSSYTSKPLRDFIYESNRGNTIFFVPDEAAAIEKLSAIK